MIPRYTRDKMGKIFTDESRFKIMLEVELLACEGWSKLGKIPRAAVQKIRKKARINTVRILEIEQTVKHDVIAFLTQVAETVGPESRYIHIGITSSDVLDTALSVQMVRAADILIDDMERLKKTIGRLARKHKHTIMMGRSHGIHAEPTTFGLKMAGWYTECGRGLERLQRAKAIISVGQISGAVGTYAHLDPRVESYVCRKLGLKPALVSTQVLQRDRHAEFLTHCAVVASTLEKFATEIRHLQRTEVKEAEEPFSKGQKGSSAMPHKRNPIATENICGLARLVRSNAIGAMENVALWHERDISHSSIERVIVPDTCILLDFILCRMERVLAGLDVYPANMKKNMALTSGIIASQQIMLKLVDKGMLREDGYRIVQAIAMKCRDDQNKYRKEVRKNPDIRKLLSVKDIDTCFDLKYYVRWVDTIFKRIDWTGDVH